MRLYRYEVRRYSVVIDAECEIYGSSVPQLICDDYLVTAKTPQGYWIGFYEGHKWRWVSKTSKKRFAHPTIVEAQEAYKIRKMSYVKHSEVRLRVAKEDLALCFW